MHLDQFYTKKSLAKGCFMFLEPILRTLTDTPNEKLYFIEPSVGRGDFYDLLPNLSRLGIDIDTKRNEFVRANFLTWSPEKTSFHSRKRTIVIGNPPFGHRSKMAVDFFNKASDIADTIAFVLPVVFRKFFIHKQLNTDFKWVKSYDLPRDAFYTDKDKDYSVNTEFQVWTRLPNPYANLRLFSPPPTKHEDFVMYQYNNTKEALKVFDNPFDFAVPSQGWQDYSRRENKPQDCEKQKQWMLFKPKVRKGKAHHILYEKIDYNQLAMKNTTAIPGFRKNDVVQEYVKNYG